MTSRFIGKHQNPKTKACRQYWYNRILLLNVVTRIVQRWYLKLADDIKFILITFSLVVKQAMFAYVNYAWSHSWNQPVLSNESKVSCSRKQREPLLGLKLTTDRHDADDICNLQMTFVTYSIYFIESFPVCFRCLYILCCLDGTP